jgi:hypothetical protein
MAKNEQIAFYLLGKRWGFLAVPPEIISHPAARTRSAGAQ